MKSERQKVIVELIQNEMIDTQEELAKRLNELGFNITQATVSRDIRALKLVKKSSKNGISHYTLPVAQEVFLGEKYVRILKEGFVSADNAQNILVIKTVSGMAMAVCAAIDAFKWSEIVGSIAGDDTIMCAVRTTADAVELIDRIKRLIKN